MISAYLNINSFFDYKIKFDGGPSNLPRSIVGIERSTNPYIKIPQAVLAEYSAFRPTPLFRAERFEKAINSSCSIFVKDESKTPTGNHKANSAFFIAALCKADGLRMITTETTGNWGIALAIACEKLGLQSISFLDSVSQLNRPETEQDIALHGGITKIVDTIHNKEDLLKLSAEAAIKATLGMPDAAYIFGSVYGYFVIPQSIIGLEAKEQLQTVPDIVVGSCGGGANLLGICAPYIVDKLNGRWDGKIISAESDGCPILSSGAMGWQSIDSLGYYPLMETYAIDGLRSNEYIGGLGSTIVAGAAAHFHQSGLIHPEIVTADNAIAAARIFEQSQGIRVALETSYQLAAVIKAAKEEKNKVILTNISIGQNDHRYYSRRN